MKLIALTLTIVILAFTHSPSLAHEAHHAKHNMVLFGATEIFASHIVYKVPHNFQVILQVGFARDIKELYLKEKQLHPNDEFIFLLDPMDIKEIAAASTISGQIFRLNDKGEKIELADRIRLERKDYQVIFFDEVPLSLAN